MPSLALLPEKKASVDSIPLRYTVAVAASWCAELGTYPFDLTKTRLQIQSEVATAKHGFKLEYGGMIRTTISIAQKEGVLALWTGLTPMLHRHAIYSGCRIVIYENLRNYFKDSNGQTTFGLRATSGLIAGAAAQFIASPTDLIKVLMQAEGRRRLQGKAPRVTSTLQAYALVYKESGVVGLWRGAIPNVQRAALVNVGDLTAYDLSKSYLVGAGMPDTLLLHAISGFIAGFVSAAMGTPADVIKTRLMNQPVGPDGRGLLYRGVIDCLKQSVKNEGLLSLYKGFVPVWLRLGPWALIHWIVFEEILSRTGSRTF